MKKYFLYTVLLLCCNISVAQTVKLNFGRTISSVKSSHADLDILNKTINTTNVGIGVDLFEKENYYLSNEINFSMLGGKEKNIFLEAPYDDYSKKWGYLSLSSSLRYKINFDESKYLFIGAGPKINFIIDSNKFSQTLYEDTYVMKNYTFGVLTELGYVQRIFERYKVGIVGSYSYSITPNSKTEFNRLRINPIAINLTLGYSL
ncbi:Outer membrane protein beta-barrel domain-containing protein [Paenimyroides ummariense]|uniref:Outer membrane protein beta-barrel domain-containing protein n=1 Tax=Paenimyroides ummariense TaxID=913024 RepID=A0A1I5EZD9_9FLAO|nr:outer membrane beta-barrel protein [Paenimyroides ummariense]SFO16750.1 Outer membrane protein beta-barrel domain-containing protein [Paenimyroides ummariense]